MKRILIIGISGQDGTLLAQQLKKEGAEYIGLDSRGVVASRQSAAQSGSLSDAGFIKKLISSFSPTHIYYLAAHHHSSQDTGIDSDASLWNASLQVQVLGLAHTLEAMRGHERPIRLFYASSSHIFGSTASSPQNETTATAPDNIYGITKVAGMEVCRHYREQHRLFASVGILYNHESIYRKRKFLSKKICQAVLAIKNGGRTPLVLGDLSPTVDWGYAPNYIDAMNRILELDQADVFVVATGEAHTVREFVQLAFEHENLDYQEWVKVDPSSIRPSKASLVGDSSKLRGETGWAPTLSFSEMVSALMVETRNQERSDE